MRFLFRTIVFFVIWSFMVMNIYAQETSMKSPYFKVLKSENIDFRDYSNVNVISTYRSFNINDEDYKHVHHQNKYGIFNLTKNKWVVNLQYERVNSIDDSLYQLQINNSKAKLLHINKNSKYNVFGFNEIEVKNDYVILKNFDEYPSLIKVDANRKSILPYKTASFINDSLIRVSNENNQFNVVDLNGNLKFNNWWNFIYFEEDKLFASYSSIANNQLKIELNIKTGELAEYPIIKVNKITLKKDKISKKFKIYSERLQSFPILLDSFILNDDRDLIGVVGNKYISLLNGYENFFTNLDLKEKLKVQDLIVDSISYDNNPHYVKIYKNKKSGLISFLFGPDLFEPKHELISIFGNSLSKDKHRYFIKSGREISIFDNSGTLLRKCPCDNPFRASLKISENHNDIIICFQNSGSMHAYDINGVAVDLSTLHVNDEMKKSINLNNLSETSIIQIGGKYGVISKNKKIIIPPIYEYIRKTSFDGIYLIEERTFRDRFVHLIDTKSGKKSSYPGFRLPWSNSNITYFDLQNRKGSLDHYEISLIPFKLIPIKYFKELIHLKSIILKKNGKYGMESFDGNTIINFSYDYCYEFDHRLLGVKNEQGKYAIFNELGIQLTDYKYDTLFAGIGITKDTISIIKPNYNNGTNLQITKMISGYNFIKKASSFILVEKNGKLGGINLNGDLALNAENDWISDESSHQKYLFKRNGKFYFIPSNENEIFKNGVDTAFFFKNIIHHDDYGVVIYKIGTKYGVHRPNLQFTEALFDDIYEIHRDYLLVEIDRKLGLYDIKRKTYILESEYNGIFYTDKNNITVIKGNLLQTVSINNQ